MLIALSLGLFVSYLRRKNRPVELGQPTATGAGPLPLDPSELPAPASERRPEQAAAR